MTDEFSGITETDEEIDDLLDELESKFRKAISTDEGMRVWLNVLFGPDGWIYDPSADVWMACNPEHIGPGRGYYVFTLGGEYNKIIVPEEILM